MTNKPGADTLDFSPLLKPLLIVLLLLLLILSILCSIARIITLNKISKAIIEEVTLPIKAPTSLPPTSGLPINPPTPPANVAAATALLTPNSPAEGHAPPLLTPTPSSLSASTSTPLPTSTPPPIFGIVTTAGSQRLNVREGPNVTERIITHLESGDKITILQRTPAGDWLEIETPDQQRGWVAGSQVEILGDIKDVKIATNLGPIPSGATDLLLALNIEGGRASGQISPHQEQWYTFFEENEETIIVFIFIPNVNSPPGAVQFFLHDQKQISVWPPKDPNVLENIGAGSRPASDRDGNDKTGELIWRGGPLIPGVRYYLRFVNRSGSVIQYCLAARDEYRWSCPQN